MILDSKNFDSIEADDILGLIPDVAEGRRLDYKELLPGSSEKEVRSFLADVCALANSAGGYLMYGVSEARDDESGSPTGLPQAVVGVGDVNDDEVIRAWQQRITQNIEPAIIGHRVRVVSGFDQGRKVMLVFVPQSLFAPHRVNYQGKKEFYVRHDRSNLPMDIGEIRQAFIEAKQLPQRLDELRRVRVSQILADETPIELLPGTPVFLLHAIPVSAFADDAGVDVTRMSARHSMRAVGYDTSSGRLNADGFVYRGGEGSDYSRCYAQVFRDGVIEVVSTVKGITDRGESGGPLLPSQWQEEEYIKTALDVMTVLEQLEVRPPVYFGVSLLRVRGVAMATPQRFWDHGAMIDKDHLLTPFVTSETLQEDPATLLKPAFDALWQASGIAASPYYDDQGKWSRA